MTDQPSLPLAEWSIDRVVYEFCHNEQPPWVQHGHKPIPNKEQLEQTLRANDVDGNILTELQYDELKTELNITSLGQRKTVEKALRFLRGDVQPSATPAPLSLYEKVHKYQEGMPTPELSRRSPYAPSLAWHSVTGDHQLGNRNFSPSAPVPTVEARSLNSQLPRSQPLFDQHDSLQVNVGSQDISMIDPINNVQPLLKSPAGILDRLDASIDQSLRPAKAQREGQQTIPPEGLERVQAVQVSKPKRRIAPTLIRPIQKKLETESKMALADSVRSDLSKEIVSLQDIFYGVDGESDDDDEILHVSQQPPGTSKVINRRIQHFLRQKPQVTHVLPYEAFYKLPYPIEACAGPISEPQFTLFASNADPSVQKLSDWSEIKIALPPSSDKRLADVIVAGTSAQALSKQEANTDDKDSLDLGDYAYLLDKYPVATSEDSEDILPVYGDSDDEAEFDEETWQEIEDERQEQATKMSFLTKEQVKHALMEAVDEIREKWTIRKLQKVQMKAYRLWMKVAKARRRAAELDAYYALRSHKIASLNKMQDLILTDTWRKAEDVKAQCDVLEETVFMIQEAEHMLEVLHKNVPPIKPATEPTKRRARSRPALPADEESLDSDSDIEVEVEQPMADFVMDDGDSTPADDPRDEDFHPLIPRGQFRRVDPALPVAVEQNQVDAIAEDESSPTNNTKSLHEDADGESDGPSDDIISPARKVHKQKLILHLKKQSQGPYRSEDWSPSTASPNTPMDVDSEDNSDLDRPKLPATRFKAQGHSKESAIELTSSPARPEYDSTGGNTSVATPPLNPLTFDSDDEPLRRKKPRPQFQPPAPGSATPTTVLSLADRISVLEAALRSLKSQHPAEFYLLQDTVVGEMTIGGLDWAGLLSKGLLAMQQPKFTIPHFSYITYGTAFCITKLFMSFVQKKDLLGPQEPSQADVEQTYAWRNDFYKDFGRELQNSLQLFDQNKLLAGNLRKERQGERKLTKTQTRKRKRPNVAHEEIYDSEDSDLRELFSNNEALKPDTPHRKKKKTVQQSQEALDVQKSDRARIAEQERRRQLVIDKMGALDSSLSQTVVVNFVEPLVHLDEHIARLVKPHQIDGIQFLWREIVEDPRHQGCLLAHTMGLGKTMQVISMLVTIAQCSSSQVPEIVSHVPKKLRDNKTLILCPPSLTENWNDELLMWDSNNVLGEIYKIVGRSATTDSYIKRWTKSGGVIIISYDTFRSLLKPRKGNADHIARAPQYEQWLLDTPSLVVADEAHKLKNSKSGIAMLSKRFKTKSRVALTGSPLNNHLEEYHTMVEWIAPGYLGDIAQFRSKYIEPINLGLFADSTPYERRLCLRKLHTLKKDIAPKVNRADITAIRKDMPPKTEYIITIPLMEAQRQAYDTYVAHLLRQHDARGKTTANGLFKWMNNLMVLAAHPSCFIKVFEAHDKLEGNNYESSDDVEAQSADQARETLNDLTEEYDPLNAEKISASDLDAERAAVKVFDNQSAFDALYSPELSYRTLITQKLVEKAVAKGDKTLVFSHSIPTLDYLERMLRDIDPDLERIDGKTKMSDRQKKTKAFNEDGGTDSKVILISTKAGGLGLNLQGANRVIIFDSGFNPMWEEQAVGRAYRLGQTTDVFVYRFKCGGTFEEPIYNKALFKTQLFQRVVDKKNPKRAAAKSVSQYLFPSKDVVKHDFEEFLGRDKDVMDAVVNEVPEICNLELTETFQRDDGEELNAEELKQADAEQELERLRREEPDKWKMKLGLLSPPRASPATVNTTQPAAKVKSNASLKIFDKIVTGAKEQGKHAEAEVSHQKASQYFGQNDGPINISDNSDSSSGMSKKDPAGCKNQ